MAQPPINGELCDADDPVVRCFRASTEDGRYGVKVESIQPTEPSRPEMISLTVTQLIEDHHITISKTKLTGPSISGIAFGIEDNDGYIVMQSAAEEHGYMRIPWRSDHLLKIICEQADFNVNEISVSREESEILYFMLSDDEFKKTMKERMAGNDLTLCPEEQPNSGA